MNAPPLAGRRGARRYGEDIAPKNPQELEGSNTTTGRSMSFEDAERQTPICHCGAPTVLVADADFGVWLQCSATSTSTSPVRRFVEVLGGHVRHQVLG